MLRRGVVTLSALLLAAGVHAACSKEERGEDLYCSACQMFIESYMITANKPVFLTKRDKTAKGVYKQRISAIYREHNPDSLRVVDGMLKIYKGKEHLLYQKVCYKYNTAIEPAYSKEDADSIEEEVAWKEAQAGKALDEVMEKIKVKDAQWAIAGKEGNRRYVDFNKAMSSGDSMDNMSMGGNVGKELEECFSMFRTDHLKMLTSALANSARLYDSGIDKSFCVDIEACAPKPPSEAEASEPPQRTRRQREQDVRDANPDDSSEVDDDVETEEIDHDEL